MRSDAGTFRYSDAELIERHSVPEPNSGCWLWLGHVNKWGYGRLGLNRSERQAHRLSYRTFVGPIPPELKVLHKCDVPCCVNPDHLRLGTLIDNAQDCITRGRHNPARGERQGRSKLTWHAATEIRSSDASAQALAEQFGVHVSTIYYIREGKTWKQ